MQVCRVVTHCGKSNVSAIFPFWDFPFGFLPSKEVGEGCIAGLATTMPQGRPFVSVLVAVVVVIVQLVIFYGPVQDLRTMADKVMSLSVQVGLVEEGTKAQTAVSGVKSNEAVLLQREQAHALKRMEEGMRKMLEDTKNACSRENMAGHVRELSRGAHERLRNLIQNEGFHTGASLHSTSGVDIEMFRKYFVGKNKGFFVDVGAGNGIQNSNSLFFESFLNWRGMLIEPIPETYTRLKRNRPLSRCLNMGVCKEEGIAEFVYAPESPQWAGRVEDMSPAYIQAHHPNIKEEKKVQVICGSLGREMGVLGVEKVDLFFLDASGAELVVLESLDWSIPIRFFVIEAGEHNAAKNKAVRALLESKNYQFAGQIGSQHSEVYELQGYPVW